MAKRKQKTMNFEPAVIDLSEIIEAEESYGRKTSGLPSLLSVSTKAPTTRRVIPTDVHTLRIPKQYQQGKVKLYIAKRAEATRNVLERILR